MDKIVVLKVKYKDRKLAKSLGARWSEEKKTWYIDQYSSELKTIKEWIPETKIIEERLNDEDIIERYFQIPCRFNNGKEVLSYIGVKRRDIKKDTGFCGMCDSNYIEEYIIKKHKIEFHHLWGSHTDKKLSAREEYLLFEYLDLTE